MGVSIPQYSDEELEKFRTDNEKGITYNGKHYTLYEATQRQRNLEASIRKQRRRILIDEATGDEQKLQTDQIKGQLLKQEYARFSKAAGLRQQHDRMETVGYNWKQERAAEKAFEQAQQEVKPTKRYADVTEQWRETATPNSHAVEDAQEVTVNGVTYRVSGNAVVQDHSAHEKEIAELLEKEFGGEIKMLPRVNNPKGVKTPDYFFRGENYDLKTIGKTEGKNPLFNRVKKSVEQSNNFILEITDLDLSVDKIAEQIEKVFTDRETKNVDTVIIIRDGSVTVYKKTRS